MQPSHFQIFKNFRPIIGCGLLSVFLLINQMINTFPPPSSMNFCESIDYSATGFIAPAAAATVRYSAVHWKPLDVGLSEPNKRVP